MKLERKSFLRFWIAFGVGAACCLLLRCTYGAGAADVNWPAVTKESRPWIYWWWLGSAVDREGLTEHLEAYRKAGMGGVHVIPIYGIRGEEERFIEYLSPRWMEMLGHATKEAERLGMGVDMSTGTGWPPGGPNVDVEGATAAVEFCRYELDGGERLVELVKVEDERAGSDGRLQALMGFGDGGEVLDLTERVASAGRLDWEAPMGRWKLYAVFQVPGGKKVERAAPGGAGYIVDPFSTKAMSSYLVRFDKAFARYKGRMPRAQYHDSYEYGRATWTDDLLEQFERRRGYDLRRYLPALMGEGDEEVVARVKCDYRETVSDLHLDYVRAWAAWCRGKGCLTRNQAHGSPSNLLDTYAAADIPETEIFGPSGFEIPGLRMEPDFSFHAELNDPLMLKFASSAAHVTGRKLVASETCTWLGEHFRVSLAQVKPEVDHLFVSGINHVVYHGMAYSPFDEAWPGWLFYASVNFSPSNSFWRDFPELNAYVGRCQSVLQSGTADNDILLYWPVHDVWHNKDGMLMHLSVHGIGGWMHGTEFYDTAKKLWDRGYSFDYVSDRQLSDAKVSSGKIRMMDAEYSVLVVPKCRFMPLRTLKKLVGLAEGGATVIVQGQLPSDVPGLGELEKRREQFNKMAQPLLVKFSSTYSTVQAVRYGKGRFLISHDLEAALGRAGVVRECVVDKGIEFIRRGQPEGHHYFLANLGAEVLDGWVRLGVLAKSAVILDGLRGASGLAAVREAEKGMTEVYLQLEPGQSCILRTFAKRKVEGPRWRYLKSAGEGYEIKGTWEVDFIEGGPVLPAGFKTDHLASWTELGDEEAKRFAGTARYKITFDIRGDGVGEWVLDLGRVCESARVRINGKYAGSLWSIPFKMAVGEFLGPGKNVLEVEVTNLSANRIADLDRRKVNWKKFYEINFVNIKYEKFDASGWPLMDSGLLGPVRLIPQVLIEPGGKK